MCKKVPQTLCFSNTWPTFVAAFLCMLTSWSAAWKFLFYFFTLFIKFLNDYYETLLCECSWTCISFFCSSSICLFVKVMQGSRVPRGVMSTETAFLAQTHAVSERSSSVSWDSADLTSKTDLPSVPAFPETLGWLATVQGGKRQSNNLWLTSHVLPVTHTHTKPRLNKRDFIL